jgi:prepilin-type N-terminal cleavage/methylation domain-containing protein
MTKLHKGFTLIELIVVIAILAVLGGAAVVIINPLELIRRGQDTSNIERARGIITACDVYVAANDGQSGPGNCTDLVTAGYLKANACTKEPGGITYGTTCSASIAVASTYYRAATRCGNAAGTDTTCSIPGEM